MATNNDPKASPELPKLILTRVFDAPRDLVWKAWTDPKQVAKWWGPHGFTNPVCELDTRPGGHILIHMQGPEGPAMPMQGRFEEVAPPEKLVFVTSALHDDKGHPGIETVNTVTLREQDGKTVLTLESFFKRAKPEFSMAVKGHKAGWSQSLDRLFALLSDSPEFLLTQVFDAPRELIWKVFSESDHLAKWWGPRGMKMFNVKLDFRPGGTFHYGMETPEGVRMWGKFVYREIDAPERLSFVVSFSDEKGGTTRHPMSPTWPQEVLSTLTFFEIQPGKTALIMSGVPVNASEEERRTFGAGSEMMRQGFKGTFDQLADYLALLQG